jgi:hypothetical protein
MRKSMVRIHSGEQKHITFICEKKIKVMCLFFVFLDIYYKKEIMVKKWCQEEIDKVINLLKDGKNYYEISKIMGRSRDSIRNKMSSINITYETYNPKPNTLCGVGEKYCGTCKEIKLIRDFNKNKNKSDGFNSICRVCSNNRSKKYYSDNTEHHKKVIKDRNKKYKTENRDKLIQYLLSHNCVDCGESNIIVLDFDHKDDVLKVDNISNLINSGCKWDKIRNEIDKCDVRCANCHRIRTSKQQGWYKELYYDL